jgi:hypothetical protein
MHAFLPSALEGNPVAAYCLPQTVGKPLLLLLLLLPLTVMGRLKVYLLVSSLYSPLTCSSTQVAGQGSQQQHCT